MFNINVTGKEKCKCYTSRNYAKSRAHATEIVRETRAIFLEKGKHCVRASISIISMNIKVKRGTGESEASVVRILLV